MSSDSPTPAEAHADVQLDNELFRVTRWTVPPGAMIPMHVHDYEYVVVPLVTDTMHVVTGEGEEIVAELTAGVSYTRPAGSTHQVENRGKERDIVFVEVERLS